MHNLEIQFNINIIKKLKSLHFQVDQIGSVLFILFSLYENKLELLDEFDDYNKQKRAHFLYKELEIKKLLEYNTNGKVHYSLTEAGTNLVTELKEEFNNIDQPVNSELLALADTDAIKEAIEANSDDIETWIDAWLDIFPRGVKTQGKLIRGDKQSCVRKMRVFMREYKYTKEIIMQATANYIESKRRENWAYTRCAVYFIYRVDKNDKVSDLASECENVVFNLSEGKENSTENNLEIMA